MKFRHKIGPGAAASYGRNTVKQYEFDAARTVCRGVHVSRRRGKYWAEQPDACLGDLASIGLTAQYRSEL